MPTGGFMARECAFRRRPRRAFEPIWCAWGYGRDFTVEQVFDTLPVAKRLGFRWAALDDGWQIAEGDWKPVPSKFPRGDADMKALVDRIHAAGLKAAALVGAPGGRSRLDLLHDHPDWLLLNQDGAARKITWWNRFYLCPALARVREDAAAFVREGARRVGLRRTEDRRPAPERRAALLQPGPRTRGARGRRRRRPGFFKAIWDAARADEAGRRRRDLPVRHRYSFFNMPYMNMAVASDPESSWQVRLKGKTLKALMGDRVAYFGDHVELSDGGDDFASTFGVGGVIGTNFAWPGAPGRRTRSFC